MLPVAYVVLRALLPEQTFDIPLPFNNDKALFISLVLSSMLTGVLALFWWYGKWEGNRVRVRARTLLLLISGAQLALVLLCFGQLPYPQVGDEYYEIANAIRQFQEPQRFIAFSPHRSATTWANFPAFWFLKGAWLHVFGAGYLQGRFFALLVAWLAVPFTYLVARKLYGRTGALAALALAGFLPLQYSQATSRCLVPTLSVIALWCWLSARGSSPARPRLFSLLCGLCATLVVEGHIYGGAFTLVFCALQLWEFARGLRRGEGWRQARFWSFVLGCALALIFWLAYHVALPGVLLSELPEIWHRTLSWETSDHRPFYYKIFSAILTQFWLNPVEPLMISLVVVAELWRGRKMNLILVVLCATGLTVFLVGSLTHFNYYLQFLFPFYSLLFGALVARTDGHAAGHDRNGRSLSLGSLVTILSVATLFAIQTVEAAQFPPTRKRMDFLAEATRIGREINALLPEEDIVIVGERIFYMGMPQRLNYTALTLYKNETTYLHEDPLRWPLSPPRALIHTSGVHPDRELADLKGWFLERKFRVVRCFDLPGREISWQSSGTVMLWLHPELEVPEGPTSCPAGL